MQKLTNKELLRYFDTCIDCPVEKETCKKECSIETEILRRLNGRDEIEKENQLLHERLLSNDKTYKELTECRRLSIVKDDEIMRLAEVIKTYVEQLASAQKAVEAMDKLLRDSELFLTNDERLELLNCTLNKYRKEREGKNDR